KALQPYIRGVQLEQGLLDALQHEFFAANKYGETSGWLTFSYYWGRYSYQVPARNKILNILFGIIYWPFHLFDSASAYEFNIQQLKALQSDFKTGRNNWNQFLEPEKRQGLWFLSLRSIPRFAQMHEKVRESITVNHLALIEVETSLFRQKFRRWPHTVLELEKACNGDQAIGSSNLSSIPEVKVTSYFVSGGKNPAGNQITFSRKGEVPKTSGIGWLYDSNNGNIFINSTVKDSKAIPYSFYGFE
ncbi:MAG TPA: hypothetical protein VMV05_05470, partial [bacterium]|nr:hypothetical protein [bacterium]